MNWINTYHDMSSQQKRQLRQQILSECEISKKAFYNYLAGKNTRKIIDARISVIVTEFKERSGTFRSDAFLSVPFRSL